jgi:peptide-methionine (S)-S-oxide reductase
MSDAAKDHGYRRAVEKSLNSGCNFPQLFDSNKRQEKYMCRISARLAAMLLLPLIGFLGCNRASAAGAALPGPEVDAPAAAGSQQTAVLAGGCFWGIQLVFQHVKGVSQVTSGYSGGSASTAEYEEVSTGLTGHAESVKITYDPAQVTYGQLLRVFFSVAHNPTELNRQGPDSGTQYRSAIFYENGEQKRIAEAYIAQLGKTKAFAEPIVTQVVPLQGFYPAEGYHQNYATLHPDNPYIRINDLPKLDELHRLLPELYATLK